MTLLSDMPVFEGLCFRSITSEEDAEALYAVRTGCMERDQVDPHLHCEDMPSLEDLRRWISLACAAGEQDHWRVALIDGNMAGYSQIERWHEMDGVWVYFIGGWVLPEWRGRGLGTALLHWGEGKARKLAGEQHPGERIEYAANASCTECDAEALLQCEGYDVGFTTLELRYDLSTRLPAEVTLPDRIEIRPVLPEHHPPIIASIIECYHNAFPGNRFRSTFDRDAYFSNKLKDAKFKPEFLFVAWDGDEVAGQVFMVTNDGEVYVDQVSVRPTWRRKGLARALMIRALRGVLNAGYKDIWLDTFAEYQTRAIDLYRSLGFSVVKSYRRYRKAVL